MECVVIRVVQRVYDAPMGRATNGRFRGILTTNFYNVENAMMLSGIVLTVTKMKWIDDPLPMPADLEALANALVSGEKSIRSRAGESCR